MDFRDIVVIAHTLGLSIEQDPHDPLSEFVLFDGGRLHNPVATRLSRNELLKKVLSYSDRVSAIKSKQGKTVDLTGVLVHFKHREELQQFADAVCTPMGLKYLQPEQYEEVAKYIIDKVIDGLGRDYDLPINSTIKTMLRNFNLKAKKDEKKRLNQLEKDK